MRGVIRVLFRREAARITLPIGQIVSKEEVRKAGLASAAFPCHANVVVVAAVAVAAAAVVAVAAVDVAPVVVVAAGSCCSI